MKSYPNTSMDSEKKRSCESQLIETTQDLANGLNRREQIDCILLDFSKAFDKVPHLRLLKKCEFYGIRGKTLQWIKSFLSNRSQKVILDGITSDTAAVTSGVPQGTVLGPLLFLLYINDLPESISSTARLFADDCLLYRTIQNQEDAIELQKDLDTLQKWENAWLMQFNPDKCEVLRVTNRRKVLASTYTIHGKPLVLTKSAKYLGVNISCDLSWNEHISIISKKANNTNAFLNRNIKTCPQAVKEKCYKTLVRPIMEYASAIWDPTTAYNINKVEGVQRKAARFVDGDHRTTSSVTKILKDLKWSTLQERRERTKVTMLFKGIHNEMDIKTDHLQLMTTIGRTRGHQQSYHVPQSNIESHKQSFFPSAVRLWNNLPPSVVIKPDAKSFKDGLETLEGFHS